MEKGRHNYFARTTTKHSQCYYTSASTNLSFALCAHLTVASKINIRLSYLSISGKTGGRGQGNGGDMLNFHMPSVYNRHTQN